MTTPCADSTARLVIGMGNLHRSDDAAGIHVARRLDGRLPKDVQLHECRGETTELLALWAGTGKVVVVDALDSDRPAGSIIRIDAVRGAMPSRLQQTSTHGFGLAQAVELARALGELPAGLIVFGIQGIDFRTGHTLSPAVGEAIESCCLRVLDELGAVKG